MFIWNPNPISEQIRQSKEQSSAVRTELVVVPSLALYFVFGILKQYKPVRVQAFVPKWQLRKKHASYEDRIFIWHIGVITFTRFLWSRGKCTYHLLRKI